MSISFECGLLVPYYVHASMWNEVALTIMLLQASETWIALSSVPISVAAEFLGLWLWIDSLGLKLYVYDPSSVHQLMKFQRHQ